MFIRTMDQMNMYNVKRVANSDEPTEIHQRYADPLF